jgi:carbamoyltransferase
VIILGINAFHADSAAALIRDGTLVAAAEEERFRRVKHWAGFPKRAIAYCLQEAGIGLADIDHVAVNQDNRANLGARLRYVLSGRAGVGLVAERLSQRRARGAVPDLLAEAFAPSPLRAEFHTVEHHLAHLSSAFHVSPFEDAAVVSLDGFGDFASAAWGVGRGTAIEVARHIYFPHSLGIFYQALTQYLGFPHYGDEYKVMGLAPYGAPAFLPQLRRLVRFEDGGGFSLDLRYFRHHRARIAEQWSGGPPVAATLYSSALADLIGPARGPDEPLEPRHCDIACSAQAVYEEAFVHLLNAVHDRTGDNDLALAGGCAMNSVANGKVRRMTPFRRVYVQAAAGDAGGALGAAFAVWHRLGGRRAFVMEHAYWGPQFAADAAPLVQTETADLQAQGCRVEAVADERELCRRTARALADGKVVGWFQGRMEWGPRALGNRSILADPRRADMKEILNAKIKRRESFRPFAPSVLEEAVSDWFEECAAVPFMMQVLQVRADKRAAVPAVTHVDGSGRLQTVSARTNPLYHRLISTFRDLTGVPMLLNTSFNENEPVVCRPQEALACFRRTCMDMLVIEDRVIER